MSYEKHTDLQSLPVKNPYPEMPVLCTPDQFGTLRLPTPPVTERHVVGSHLSSLRSHRVTGRISDSDVEVRCNKQGIVTDPSGGGRRRVVANFPSPDSLSRDRVVKSVAGQSSALDTSEVYVIVVRLDREPCKVTIGHAYFTREVRTGLGSRSWHSTTPTS